MLAVNGLMNDANCFEVICKLIILFTGIRSVHHESSVETGREIRRRGFVDGELCAQRDIGAQQRRPIGQVG